MNEGTVTRARGGRYEVTLDNGSLVDASLRGRLKTEYRTGNRVVIGDRVRIDRNADGATIEEVLPRVSELVRRGPGGRQPKILAANLDNLVVVVAAVTPEVSPELVDRLLVVGESSGILCTLVINKLDLSGAKERARVLTDLYEGIGYRVILTSAETALGRDALHSVLCGGTSALMGPSGAGKSSLLNTLDPGLDLRVGEVSWKIGRGRHTTVTSRLIELDCGGRVADTPGIGDVGLWGVEPAGLDQLFPEFRSLTPQCRFRSCSHLHEPDCAVKAALADGAIDSRRYGSYVTLRGEVA